jgi:hypothetical protein
LFLAIERPAMRRKADASANRTRSACSHGLKRSQQRALTKNARASADAHVKYASAHPIDGTMRWSALGAWRMESVSDAGRKTRARPHQRIKKPRNQSK